LASVLLTYLPLSPVLFYLGRRKSKSYSRIIGVRRRIASISSSLAGISYRIRYDEEIDWSKTFIIVANHTSNLDIVAIMKACPTDFSFIGKDDLLKNPVTGFFFRTVDIPVNRASKMSSFRAFNRAKEYLLEGKSIAMFPEGGINDTFPPELQEFKNGGFKLASDLNIPILPVIIEDAWKIHWDDAKAFGSKPGTIHVHVLKPIEASALKLNSDELRLRVQDLFKQNLESQ